MQPSPNSNNKYEAFLSARLPKVPVGQLRFASASEYACAKLLERHCEFKAYPGSTFQVPVGRCFFDFRIGNCLVEYHPISLRHEFLRPEALNLILSAARDLGKDKRAQLLKAVAEEFRAQYEKRRSQVASAHPTYKNCEVICCVSPEEFIDKVVHRHATGAIAATEDLLLEFRRFHQEGKKASRG